MDTNSQIINDTHNDLEKLIEESMNGSIKRIKYLVRQLRCSQTDLILQKTTSPKEFKNRIRRKMFKKLIKTLSK
jgi:hypothetical protein